MNCRHLGIKNKYKNMHPVYFVKKTWKLSGRLSFERVCRMKWTAGTTLIHFCFTWWRDVPPRNGRLWFPSGQTSKGDIGSFIDGHIAWDVINLRRNWNGKTCSGQKKYLYIYQSAELHMISSMLCKQTAVLKWTYGSGSPPKQ